MEIDYLVVADAAATADGKHFIHGAGWDTIWAASFPIQHPQLAVALRVRVPWADTNKAHELEIDVHNADAHSILPAPFKGVLNFGRPPLPEPMDQTTCLTANLAGLTFGSPGTYAVVVSIDSLEAARSPFHVRAFPGMLISTPQQSP